MIDVAKLVEDTLRNGRSEKERSHKVFYASELGYCPVKIFYNIVKPRPTELCALKVFQVGDLVHEYIQRIIQDNTGAEVEVPVRTVVDLSRGIEIHGRIDVLYENVPYELKSTAKLPLEPYSHHVAQLNAYLKLMDAKEGYLVYVEKNTFDIAQFKVQRNDYLWDLTLEKIRAVHDAVERYLQGESEVDVVNGLKDHFAGGWECKYCVYRDICNLTKVGQLV